MDDTIPGSISCGSKLFILGEYLALTGGPALVASVEPGFSLVPGADAYRPSQPAARLLQSSGSFGASFHDPLKGDGGIGRSTAEFALTLFALGTRDVREAYDHYRQVTASDSDPPPSGYDLVAQWLGGTHWISGQRSDELDCEAVDLPPDWRFLIFSASHIADRKTATHEHLRTLSKDFDPKRLMPAVELGRASIRNNDLRGMGEAMNHFADELYALGLEHPDAHEDRIILGELPGVLGVKGCGALLSDTMIVLMDQEGTDPSEVIRMAEDRGLRLYSTGIQTAQGVRHS